MDQADLEKVGGEIMRLVGQRDRGLFGAEGLRVRVYRLLSEVDEAEREDDRRVRCENVSEAWGPHEGCKEFMDAPETWRCDADATHFIVTKDHGPEGASVAAHNVCEEHYKERVGGWVRGELVPYVEMVTMGRL